MSAPSVFEGRLCVLGAAVLWSLSGAFVKLLTSSDDQLAQAPLKLQGLGLNSPAVPELVIACYRTLFAGLLFLPFLRRPDLSFRPLMVGMVVCFATMNALFVTALGQGTAANAIVLQYTAPLWMYLASVFLLKEPTHRRDTLVFAIAMTGMAIIIADALRQPTTFRVVMIALGSGLAYAGVILCLRLLRGASARWLTVQNHLFAALVLLPLLWSQSSPTLRQIVFLAFFGSVQMAIPYWLVSRGLKSVAPQEVGTITLLEPLLNPVWAYLAAGDVPALSTCIGGALILGALVWRYFPTRKGEPAVVTPK